MNNNATGQIDTVIPLLWRGTEGEVLQSQFIGRRMKPAKPTVWYEELKKGLRK